VLPLTQVTTQNSEVPNSAPPVGSNSGQGYTGRAPNLADLCDSPNHATAVWRVDHLWCGLADCILTRLWRRARDQIRVTHLSAVELQRSTAQNAITKDIFLWYEWWAVLSIIYNWNSETQLDGFKQKKTLFMAQINRFKKTHWNTQHESRNICSMHKGHICSVVGYQTLDMKKVLHFLQSESRWIL